MTDETSRRVFTGARWPFVLSLVPLLGFLWLGAALAFSSEGFLEGRASHATVMLTGWAGLIFFGAIGAFYVARIIQPDRVTLTREALMIKTVTRRADLPWRDIESFSIRGAGGMSVVLYHLKPPSDLATGRMGTEGAVPPRLGVGVDEMRALLTEWRRTYG